MTLMSAGRTITESDLVAFASLTGDRHPQHTDVEWCAGSPFGERIAHGMLVLSYAIGLMPLDPERVAALRGIENAVFKRPVRVGDTIRVEARAEPSAEDGALAAHDIRIVNQDDKLVALATLKVLLREQREADAPEGREAEVADRREGEAPVAGEPVLL